MMKILVVEDKKEWMDPLAKGLRELLKARGDSEDCLHAFCNGRDTYPDAIKALDTAKGNGEKFDITILDLRLESKPNIQYLNPFKASVYEGIEIYEKYKEILGNVIFSTIPETIDILSNLQPEYTKIRTCPKDFSWDENDSQQYPGNIINEIKKILYNNPNENRQ